MSKIRCFGELELAVLEAVRERGEVSVKDVLAALGEKDRYTTVMTVMSRLAEKGELSRRRVGRLYLYRIVEKKVHSSWSLLERLKRKLFGGNSIKMIRYLLDDAADMEEKDLEELEKLIDDAKRKRHIDD
ncbi:MAG: BlaI family transcriptional regulator [Waddliaceae bacterium]|nr:BlaI family transcriptional regulator [Waddliaceae bacterium]